MGNSGKTTLVLTPHIKVLIISFQIRREGTQLKDLPNSDFPFYIKDSSSVTWGSNKLNFRFRKMVSIMLSVETNGKMSNTLTGILFYFWDSVWSKLWKYTVLNRLMIISRDKVLFHPFTQILWSLEKSIVERKSYVQYEPIFRLSWKRSHLWQ